MVEPMFPKKAWSIFVMLANLANMLAPSSLVMLVLLPKSIMVFVKSARLSLPTPNCPAFAMTFAISDVPAAISVDICLTVRSNPANSVSDASTVFLTFAKAFSKSILALTAPTAAPIKGVLAYVVKLLPTFCIPRPTPIAP